MRVVSETEEVGLTRAAETLQNTQIEIADGLELSLWASDSLAPDPVAMSIDDFGKIY